MAEINFLILHRESASIGRLNAILPWLQTVTSERLFGMNVQNDAVLPGIRKRCFRLYVFRSD